MSATCNFFEQFPEDLAHKVHDFSSDTFKLTLHSSAPSASADAVYADLADELSTANGYTNGGYTITISSSAQTSGVYKWIIADLSVTASGGSIGPWRYAVIRNSTASGGPLVCWFDYGSNVTVASGDTFPVDFSATTGVINIEF